jgi:soluble lytic murein transglycosylase-like protein/Tfp pilus assembly protein PilF
MRRAAIAGLGLVLVGCAAQQPHPAPRRAAGVAPQAASTAGRRALFANAYRHIEKGDYAQAIPLLEPLSSSYPELQDYALYYLALCSEKTGDEARAARLWQRMLDTNPRSLNTPRALLGRGRILLHQGHLSEARRLLLAARGSPSVAQSAALELGYLEDGAGNPAAAYEYFMSVRRDVPGGGLDKLARQQVTDLRRRFPALEPQGDELEEEAHLLLREGDPGAARALVGRLLPSAGPADAPRLLRLRADAQRADGDLEGSLATLQEIARRYPDSPQAPEALYRYATLLWNRDRDGEAKRGFVAYHRRYPGGARDAAALYAIGRIDQTAGDDAGAIASYDRLARAYPSADLAREGRWRIGWIEYREGRWRDAAVTFARLSSGDDATEALYWRGRALQRAGDREAALAIYRRVIETEPLGYYAHWAERRLGTPATGPVRIVAPSYADRIGPPPPGCDPYHLVRARELQAAGLREPARRELRAFEDDNPSTPELARFLVAAYPAVDGYRDLIRLGYENGNRDPELRYPLAFWSLVTRETASRGPDSLLVVALMRQESLFDPDARSPAGARGLMQLLPETAERIAREIGRPSVGDLYEPQTNVALGVAYLDRLVRRYGGDTLKAIAAYNGGENAVAKWEGRFGDLEPDEFVESITYRETREYVKKVLANYRRYREQYGAPSAASLAPTPIFAAEDRRPRLASLGAVDE